MSRCPFPHGNPPAPVCHNPRIDDPYRLTDCAAGMHAAVLLERHGGDAFLMLLDQFARYDANACRESTVRFR